MHETHLGCFSRDNENLKWCGIISVLIHCCIQKVNTGGGGTADWTAWWKGGGLWGYTFGVRFLFLLHRCLLCAERGTALLSRVCPCCSASLLVSKQHNQLIWPLTEVLHSESQNKDFQPKYCFSQKFWATQHRLAHFLFPISQPLPSSSLTRTLCTSIYMSLATSKRTSRLLLLQPAHLYVSGIAFLQWQGRAQENLDLWGFTRPGLVRVITISCVSFGHKPSFVRQRLPSVWPHIRTPSLQATPNSAFVQQIAP